MRLKHHSVLRYAKNLVQQNIELKNELFRVYCSRYVSSTPFPEVVSLSRGENIKSHQDLYQYSLNQVRRKFY